MRKNNQRGFSLIEILMVLILIAVLAAIAINAFVNFRTEARQASLRSNLGVLRSAIAAQIGNLQLRCGSNAASYPPVVSLNANDIGSGASGCTTGAGNEVPDADKQFVQGSLPIPPFGTTSVVIPCSGAATGCTRGNNTSCTAGAVGGFTNNWCYNEATGEIWADSDPAVTPNYEAY